KLKSKMRNLIVTLTTSCNLKCVMCDWIRHEHWEIPAHTLEEVRSMFPYLERVVWQGGEVFLYSGLKDLIKEAAMYPNLQQVITTNGLLIDEEWAELFVKSNVDLTFSIDGLTKEVYEGIRLGSDFELLIKNLNTFNEVKKKYNSNLNVNLHVVVMRSNHRQLDKYIEFARKHDFRIVVFLPIGGNYDDPENIFHPEDKKAMDHIAGLLPGIMERADKYDILIENRLPVRVEQPCFENEEGINNFDKEPEEDKSSENMIEKKKLCHLPWIQLYIDYDGYIRPDCVCLREEPVGQAEEDSLIKIWNNEKMQEYRKKMQKGNCSEICNADCTEGRVSERYLKFF
ncbi:radical SAM protein, partial [Elusimicrobiota bacterium]